MTARILVALGIAALSLPAVALHAQSTELSTLCYFTAGPRRGETVDYAPRPAIPVGSACTDGVESTGRVVAAARGTVRSKKMSTLCYFTSGPLRGDTVNYAPKSPLPIGTACSDGEKSRGRVVAEAAGDSDSDTASDESTLCRFTSGPRSGETQDYAPMAPLKVGTRCNDGQESYGRVVAKP